MRFFANKKLEVLPKQEIEPLDRHQINPASLSSQLNLPGILEPENAPEQCQKTFVEFREDTMQVPAGPHSIFAALEAREITATQAATYLVTNAKSNWESGRTHKLTNRKLGDVIDRSRGHVSRIVNGLEDYVKRTTKLGITTMYKLTHHNCEPDDVPTDPDGKPLKCAVARGAGGPVERLEAGEIDIEAFLVYIVMHIVICDWGTQACQVSIARLSQICRLGTVTVLESIQQLETVGLLRKVGKRKPHEPQCYQLYPKMKERKPRKSDETAPDQKDWRDMIPDKENWYQSFNGLWRIHHETLEIQKRPSRQKGVWRKATDKQRVEMPKKIKHAFAMLEHHLTQLAQWRQNAGYT